ncbi:MAG: hypothetical protein CM15mV24_0290 [Bellamyvirus sp.]|nr:MAG: hypothetical protein CM15mV24_0290 [Bellamyvirus sp.]
MSETGALFDPGFLGNSFHWWIGQVSDDSEWRDNILPENLRTQIVFLDGVEGIRFVSWVSMIRKKNLSHQISCLGQLLCILSPAGGGQGGSFQTPNIRQGNFVFGFFMDGPIKQVPVIMGILGTMPKTAMATKIGTTESNFAATSGYAEGKNPPTGVLNQQLLMRFSTKKPSNSETSKHLHHTPGVKLNKFGLRPDQPLSAIPDGLQIANDAERAGKK